MRIVIRATLTKGATKTLETAIARGLNEGGDVVRTATQKRLKVETGVTKYKSITSRMEWAGRGANRAAPGRLIYAIVATGKGIPIKEFPVTVQSGKGGGVDAKTWGVDHLFKRSFSVNGKLRARRGAARMPIRSLYGPALPKELVKAHIVAAWHEDVARVVPPAVLKRLAKALG